MVPYIRSLVVHTCWGRLASRSENTATTWDTVTYRIPDTFLLGPQRFRAHIIKIKWTLEQNSSNRILRETAFTNGDNNKKSDRKDYLCSSKKNYVEEFVEFRQCKSREWLVQFKMPDWILFRCMFFVDYSSAYTKFNSRPFNRGILKLRKRKVARIVSHTSQQVSYANR